MKTEVDTAIGDYEEVKSLLEATCNSLEVVEKVEALTSDEPTDEAQALKDREYLMERLKQLGITPDNQ